MSSLVLRHAKRSLTVTTKAYSSDASATTFADPRSAEFLTSASSPGSIPCLHGLPEIIVTGRANVGKSTLLNVVLGRTDLLHTSKKAGRTRTLNFYRVGSKPGKLILVDAPGYGSRGRPEWGNVFEHYIQHRTELRRVYILFNAKHGINSFDTSMLHSLNAQCQVIAGTKFTLQAVITKADAVPVNQVATVIPKMRQQIFDAAPFCLPPIITSATMQPHFGILEMRKSIVEACGIGRIKSD